MDKIKIGDRTAIVIYNCTMCEGSALTKEAFGRHRCNDYPKNRRILRGD